MTISFDDPRWGQLKGGYRLHYNPVPGLRRLAAEGDVPAVWTEFWNELHHQGDVDEASYAAVPALVDIQERGQALGPTSMPCAPPSKSSDIERGTRLFRRG